jgi:predicted dienelactone hydrolase
MRGLATHLVNAGFVVALIEHPGNNRNDDSLANTVQILEDRPRHVRTAIELAAGAFMLAPGVAVVGHSLGGYTALAVAGGRPMALPNQTPDGQARPVVVEHEPRVRAVVLLAPALPWFMAPGALAGVRAAIFVRVGERDELAPPAFTETILREVEKDYAVVPGGGHFAFFWPVPPHLVALPPGKDPPGFDRAAIQPALHADVTAFLERQI